MSTRGVLHPLGEEWRVSGHTGFPTMAFNCPTRLVDAYVESTKGQIAGAWHRSRCPGRACTATVNNPRPHPGCQRSCISVMETKASRSHQTSSAYEDGKACREDTDYLHSNHSRGLFGLGLLANFFLFIRFIYFYLFIIYVMRSLSHH